MTDRIKFTGMTQLLDILIKEGYKPHCDLRGLVSCPIYAERNSPAIYIWRKQQENYTDEFRGPMKESLRLAAERILGEGNSPLERILKILER